VRLTESDLAQRGFFAVEMTAPEDLQPLQPPADAGDASLASKSGAVVVAGAEEGAGGSSAGGSDEPLSRSVTESGPRPSRLAAASTAGGSGSNVQGSSRARFGAVRAGSRSALVTTGSFSVAAGASPAAGSSTSRLLHGATMGSSNKVGGDGGDDDAVEGDDDGVPEEVDEWHD